MTTQPRSLSPIALFTQWLLFSAFGWWAGLGLGVLLTQTLSGKPWLNEDFLLAYAALLTVGLATGIAQGVVLRSLLPRAGSWVKATFAGYLLGVLGLLSASLLRLGLPGLGDDALLLGLLGALIGLAQWWLLRQHFHQAGLWVLASALGLLFFLWLVASPSASANEFIVRGTFYGLLSALPAGLVLVWLSRHLKTRLAAV